MTTMQPTTEQRFLQGVYSKFAQLVVCSRWSDAPLENARLRHWFNVEAPELDSVRDELRYWKSICATPALPPPLVIETFLDVSQLHVASTNTTTNPQQLNNTPRRLASADLIRYDPTSGSTMPVTSILLEVWQLAITPLPTGSARHPPSVDAAFAKACHLMRVLAAKIRALPAYDLFSRLHGSQSPVALSYRMTTRPSSSPNEATLTELSPDGDANPPIQDLIVSVLDTPLGALTLSVKFRVNCNFVLPDIVLPTTAVPGPITSSVSTSSAAPIQAARVRKTSFATTPSLQSPNSPNIPRGTDGSSIHNYDTPPSGWYSDTLSSLNRRHSRSSLTNNQVAVGSFDSTPYMDPQQQQQQQQLSRALHVPPSRTGASIPVGSIPEGHPSPLRSNGPNNNVTHVGTTYSVTAGELSRASSYGSLRGSSSLTGVPTIGGQSGDGGSLHQQQQQPQQQQQQQQQIPPRQASRPIIGSMQRKSGFPSSYSSSFVRGSYQQPPFSHASSQNVPYQGSTPYQVGPFGSNQTHGAQPRSGTSSANIYGASVPMSNYSQMTPHRFSINDPRASNAGIPFAGIDLGGTQRHAAVVWSTYRAIKGFEAIENPPFAILNGEDSSHFDDTTGGYGGNGGVGNSTAGGTTSNTTGGTNGGSSGINNGVEKTKVDSGLTPMQQFLSIATVTKPEGTVPNDNAASMVADESLPYPFGNGKLPEIDLACYGFGGISKPFGSL